MSEFVVKRISRLCEDIDNIGNLHLKDDIISLNLHGNRLLSTSGLLNFNYLVELDLSANSITELTEFDNLLCLKILNLSSNLIKSIPSNADHLKYLISLENLNLSYNLLTNVSGLSQLSSPNHSIRQILLHGNELKQTNELVNALINVKSLLRLSIKENQIEGCNQLLYKQLPQLEAIDGENRFGTSVSELSPIATLSVPKPPTTMEIDPNPWSNSETIPSVRKQVAAVTENFSSKLENQQLETNSRIQNLENLIKKLLSEKNKSKIPNVDPPKKVKNTQSYRKENSKSCTSCSKLFDEIKILQSFCDKYQMEISNMKDTITRINIESQQRDQDSKNLLHQKSSQLEACLETGSKFKIYFQNEKEKSETLEHSLARISKEIQQQKNVNTKLKQEMQLSKNENDKNCEKLHVATKKLEKLEHDLEHSQEKVSDSFAKIQDLELRLGRSVDPDSPEFAKLMRERSAQLEIRFTEYKRQHSQEYKKLEDEFREALMIESKRKSDMFAEIEKLKEENVNYRISQQKSECIVEKTSEESKQMQKRMSGYQKNISDLEDKIDRLVDALRKAKELADSRYRDEQKAKAGLKEIQKERTKLISTLTQQDGILKGLQAEREQWGTSLAEQTSDLAKQKGNLTAQVDFLKNELEKEKEGRTLLRIKEKEIDAVNMNVRDLKLKLNQMSDRTQDAEAMVADLESALAKAESRKDELKYENAKAREETDSIRVEMQSNLEKWRQRNDFITKLEKQIKSVTDNNQQKENKMLETINKMHTTVLNLEEKNISLSEALKAKSTEVETLIGLKIENDKLKDELEFERRKVFEVEEEIREILRERETEKIKLQKQMEIISKNIFKN